MPSSRPKYRELDQNTVVVRHEHDMPVYSVSNDLCTGEVSLYGAHVMKFKPKNHEEVLWMSPLSRFSKGQRIRGGIPHCFPWFGTGKNKDKELRHGYVSLEDWVLEQNETTTRGETRFLFTKKQDGLFELRFQVVFGTNLKMSMEIRNLSEEQKFTCDYMAHAYYNVKNVVAASLTGLESTPYHDGVLKTDAAADNTRVYCGSRIENLYESWQTVTIIDPMQERKIHVHANGARHVCVWNPGPHDQKEDIPKDGWTEFLCVERGTKEIVLIPKGVAFIQQTIDVEK